MKTFSHIGITIGPITKTLLNARKTRELWAASYSFAYLMKAVAAKIHTKYKDDCTFLKPALSPVMRNSLLPPEERPPDFPYTGAGLFPDQLVLQFDKPVSLQAIRSLADDALSEFAQAVAKALNQPENAVEEFFQDYFQLYVAGKNNPGKPTPELTELLNHAENQHNFALRDQSYLTDFLFNPHKPFLIRDALGTTTHRFTSIPELAMHQFLKGDPGFSSFLDKQLNDLRTEKNKEKLEHDDAGNQLIEWAKTYLGTHHPEQNFHIAHKYIAIVFLDGDGIGALLDRLYANPDTAAEQVKNFSLALRSFSLEAAQRVSRYGGLPVYFGGDDGLFFVPVRTREEGDPTHIFNLLQELDALFQGKFADFGGNAPTLSFGLSISYHKFPLHEALAEARKLLFETAKNKGPHRLAFRVLKHSGAAFGAVLPLAGSGVYAQFSQLLSDAFDHQGKDPDQLRSVTYRLKDQKRLLAKIARDPERIAAFFANNFDETVHLEASNLSFLQGGVSGLVQACYDAETDPDNANAMCHHLLKTTQFLTQTEAIHANATL